MRTTTTTREQGQIRHNNYPLLMFLYENGMHEPQQKLKKLMCVRIITDAKELTEEPDEIIKIQSMLDALHRVDVSL